MAYIAAARVMSWFSRVVVSVVAVASVVTRLAVAVDHGSTGGAGYEAAWKRTLYLAQLAYCY